MDPKLLTESGFKAVLSKYKIKDNGLQKALAAYEKLEDDEYDDRLQQLTPVSKLATTLKKDKEVAANKDVVRYLEDLLKAADTEEKQLDKDKAAAKKTAAADQKAQDKKEDKEKKEDKDKEGDDEDDKEEQKGEYCDQLLSAFRKLKSMNGSPMSFLFCEARPLPAIMVARRISSKHRKQLTEVTGGSKKFLPIGTCHYEEGKYVFTTDRQTPGLVRRLQLSVKNYTGKKFKFLHGDEAAGEDEEEGEAPKANTIS